MFDRCRRWRHDLSRRADGNLPLSEWGALEKHLSQCANCRKAFEADAALQGFLRMHTGSLTGEAAEEFDDLIVGALQADGGGALRGHTWRDKWRTALAILPLDFLSQIAGGALVAACVTGICLLPAVRSARSAMPHAEQGTERTIQTNAAQNEPPVSLESLMTNPTPRAASLWSLPTTRQSEHTRGTSEPGPRLPVTTHLTPPPPTKQRLPAEKHGAVLTSDALS